jgi:nucleoporin GLE1
MHVHLESCADLTPTVALDVGGLPALRVWGAQWVKMLALLYDGVQAKRIGGDTPEASGARVRLQLQIERVLGGA